METQDLPEFRVNDYHFSRGEHRGHKVIWVKFEKNFGKINHLKQFTKCRWSRSEVSWYVADCKAYRNLFHLEIDICGKEALLKIHEVNLPEFQKFIDLLVLKSYSPNTTKVYAGQFAQLLYTLGKFPVQEMSPERLQAYFLYCATKLKHSEAQINSRINAVKFYFEQVLHREKMFFDIPRPKKPLKLPKALNKTEIAKIFAVTENPKHSLILKLAYGMGLRVSEIANLKIEHIDSGAMKVLVERGKGKKDRYVNLPYSLLEDLRAYYKFYKPKTYLFEGQFGESYSTRSIQSVFKNAMNKAKIKKTVGIHSLRHSYATHLLEYGTDISFIQKLLGHHNIKTTQIYTHVSPKNLANVISPLDQL